MYYEESLMPAFGDNNYNNASGCYFVRPRQQQLLQARGGFPYYPAMESSIPGEYETADGKKATKKVGAKTLLQPSLVTIKKKLPMKKSTTAKKSLPKTAKKSIPKTMTKKSIQKPSLKNKKKKILPTMFNNNNGASSFR